MKFCKEKIILLVCLLLMSMVVFAGCSPDSGNVDSSKNKTHLKVGTDAFQRPAVDACVDALAEMGYDLEVVVFDDNVMPNTAIMEGTIDANMYQHVPFMETFNKTKGGKLVMLEPKKYAREPGHFHPHPDISDNR
jgi:D-methionine transport system substrate-binding protein